VPGRRAAYLDALGVVLYEPRQAPRAASRPQAAPAPSDPSTLGWDELAVEVGDCRRCELCGSRTQPVFGVGDRKARLMIVGEAPGAEEDRQGEPFVGRAGRLLNAMLRAAGLRREQVFIANILKCRPPRNRDPQPAEVAQCLPYLLRQVELVAPALILCVGRIAAQNLLGTDAPLGRLRGTLHRLPSGVPVLVTYHPAYLLRSPGEKRKAWDDLKLVMEALADGHGA
jgi:DNA polymerase